MTAFSDKYTANITSSTMNRGVEAKEAEIANTQLEGEAGAESRSCSEAATPRDCPSYLQVVVEKHRQRPPPPRLPLASSPAPAPSSAVCCMRCGGSAGGAGDGSAAAAGVAGEEKPGRGAWGGGEADCVEVYRFLRVGRALACSGGDAAGAGGGGAGGGGVRRVARRWARGARALAAEAGAAARLALGAPLAGAVLALRWVLQLARDVAQGALHAASDYTLKPALALLFNALLHPLLVFLHNLLQGSREATRPLCAALGECAGHTATVLAAVRLVEVRGAPPCTCAPPRTAQTPLHLLHNT